MSKVVHCKKEPFDVYIGRPGKWGNPFIIGKDGNRWEVIEKYRRWIQTQPLLLESLSELSGKILGCHCSPLACHGDVLLDLLKQKRPSMISLDTETTGVDLHHGAKPFIVTSCDENNEVTYWEAPVDPLTREPKWSIEDLFEIRELIEGADRIVLQNPKFDAKALDTLFRPQDKFRFPWEKVDDTLIASHLLASNQPHDLTSLALIYLGVNIAPLEDEMEEYIKECRKVAKSQYPDWRLAKAGDPTMPSAKESVWKFDMWLPKALCKALDLDESHPWNSCSIDYANADSTVTLPLFEKMKKKLEERDLWEIYQTRLKLLPIIYEMEKVGVTLSVARTTSLQTRLETEAYECHESCLDLADREIDKLPVNGTSNALKYVIFEKFGLETNYVTATGQPSLNKAVLEEWSVTLETGSKPHQFVENLRKYRKRQTSLGYMASYEKFWLPTKFPSTKVLFPSFNPTGTDTLRFSSNNPNAQQISKQEEVNLRYCFGPGPGREWWSLDAKNIELRLPAYESGEEELIDLFERPDDPPYYGSTHLLNFHTVYPDLWEGEFISLERELGSFGKALEKVGPHCKKKYASSWYQYCKNGGFAIQYGAVNITDPDRMGTADHAFHKKGAHSLLEARFSKLKKLNRKQIDFANRHGYVETMPDKTVNPRRGYPLLCTRSSYGRILETVPLSYHVQGTAMWWTGKAMIRTQEYLDHLNSSSTLGYFLIMQVHDEICLDFPIGRGGEPWKTNLPKIRKIQYLMRKGGDDIGVPTPVGCEYHGNSWAEGLSLG